MKLPGVSLTVPQLLAGLIGLGGVTLGVVGFDAERLIYAVDALKQSQAEDHLATVSNTTQLAAILPRVDGLEVKYIDVDHRLIKLEPR